MEAGVLETSVNYHASDHHIPKSLTIGAFRLAALP
jgi:hypothetical protein